MKRARRYNQVAIALFLLALLRAAFVVGTDPLIAYANSYDFLRQSGCVGIWQDYPDRPKEAAHPERPVNGLIHDGQLRPDLCMHSIDNAVPWLVASLHARDARVDFREVGGLRLLLCCVACAALLFCTGDPRLRVVLALVILLGLGDLQWLGYYNTFYLEASVLGGALLALGSLAALAAAPVPSVALVSLGAVGLVWLGLSKEQYTYLASALALAFASELSTRPAALRWSAGAFLALAAALPLTLSALNPVLKDTLMYGIDYANKTNTYLGAVLPEAHDKQHALALLGLPAHCEVGIGKSWYTPSLQTKHPCPEMRDVGRERLLRLFIQQPKTFSRPLAKALSRARPFVPQKLGLFERPSDADSAWVRAVRATSWSTALARLPLRWLRVASWLGLLSAVLCGAAWLWSVLRLHTAHGGLARAALVMTAFGSLTALYALASSVFGDGYWEIAKHAVAFPLGAAFALAGLGTLASLRIARRGVTVV
jgi:hypothetical protein